MNDKATYTDLPYDQDHQDVTSDQAAEQVSEFDTSRRHIVKPSLGVLPNEPIFEETVPPPPPSFPRKLFSDFYDNLGTLILLNVFTCILLFPMTAAGYIIWQTAGKGGWIMTPVALLIGITGPPAYGALAAYTAKISESEPREWRDYWSFFRQFFWRSWIAFLLQGGILAVILINLNFYLGRSETAFKFVGMLLLSVLFIWTLSTLYVWPMVVRGYRWRSIIRNSLVLAIASPGRTILILLIGLILTVIFVIIRVGVLAFLPATWALLQNDIFVNRRERFGSAPPAATKPAPTGQRS